MASVRALFCGLLLLTWQDDFSRLLHRLGDDSPAVREEAAERLIQGHAAWKGPLEKALSETPDTDLRERIKDVMAEGHRRGLRDGFAAALPDRARKQFPGFAGAMFSRDPSDRAQAMKGLQQTFSGDPESPYLGLYLSPGEMKRILPHLLAALHPSPGFDRVRHAFVGVLTVHDGLLDNLEWADAARALFKDPSKQVREHALMNLLAKIARPDDTLDLVARYDTLDINGRWRVLHQVAARKLESAYPLLRRELEDPERGASVAEVILKARVGPLREAAVEFIRKHPSKVFHTTLEELLPAEASPLLVRKLLHDEDGYHKAEILVMLGRLGTPDAADVAASFLADPEWKLRGAAVRCLSGIGSAKQAQPVLRLLKDHYGAENPVGIDQFYTPPAIELLVRWGAAQELVDLLEFLPKLDGIDSLKAGFENLRPAGAARRLVPFLRSGKPAVSYRALELMAASGARDEARENIDAVRALLESGHSADYVFRSVARLGLSELIPAFLEKLPEGDRLHPWMAEPLNLLWSPEERRAALRDPDPKVRIGAILATHPPESLQPMLKDPDPRVRQALALKAPGDLLLELAKDADPGVARAAAAAYFNTGRPEPLEDLLRHPAPLIRAGASPRITREFALAHPDLVRSLLDSLDPEMRKSVAERCALLDPDALKKMLLLLETEPSASKLSTALYRLQTEFSPEEAGTGLIRLYERVLRPDSPAIQTESHFEIHGKLDFDLAWVMDMAARLAPSTRGSDLKPLLLRMLDTDRAELQKGAAPALGRLGCRAAIPRLVALVPTAAGDPAAKALGELKAFPRELFGHPDEAVRKRAVLAARISMDPGFFEPLLQAAKSLSGDELKETSTALAEMAGPTRAGRLLELMHTPSAQDRRTVLEALRRWPLPSLAEPVSEFLDDTYFVRGTAADFLMDAEGDRWAVKMARQTGEYGARIVSRYGLRDQVGPILKWLEVPGNPVMESAAVETTRTLADLGMKEHLPAAVVKMKTLRSEERRRMVHQVARLGGRDAVLEELKGGDREVRLAAAEALLDAGALEAITDIRRVAREQIGSAGRIILLLGDRELAQAAISGSGGSSEWPLALAARLGVTEARPKVVDFLRRQPQNMVKALQHTWGPFGGWREYDAHSSWRYRTGRALVEKLRQDSGRDIVFALPLPDGFLESYVRGSSIDDLLQALPRDAAFWMDESGRVVIDRFERVRDAWIERLR